MFHKTSKKCELATCMIITFQVMTVTRMSARHPHTVCTFPQGSKCKLGTHPSCTWNSDNTDIRGVLHSAYTRKIRCSVTAPVTQETDYFRFPIRHSYTLLRSCCRILFIMTPKDILQSSCKMHPVFKIYSFTAKICAKISSLSKPLR
jgi:hypothetical protein